MADWVRAAHRGADVAHAAFDWRIPQGCRVAQPMHVSDSSLGPQAMEPQAAETLNPAAGPRSSSPGWPPDSTGVTGGVAGDDGGVRSAPPIPSTAPFPGCWAELGRMISDGHIGSCAGAAQVQAWEPVASTACGERRQVPAPRAAEGLAGR